eukprot:TRINITY_DN1401_c0_g1_i3.p1 TRINITY_DN1401_c0_g1~~TRINITY_DN1401_c0_g1_i3.p1  ORF type:complete len:1246 (-),score=311.55 TRINITY_DN1401_c0_g1_i3:29-3766(-)
MSTAPDGAGVGGEAENAALLPVRLSPDSSQPANSLGRSRSDSGDESPRGYGPLKFLDDQSALYFEVSTGHDGFTQALIAALRFLPKIAQIGEDLAKEVVQSNVAKQWGQSTWEWLGELPVQLLLLEKQNSNFAVFEQHTGPFASVFGQTWPDNLLVLAKDTGGEYGVVVPGGVPDDIEEWKRQEGIFSDGVRVLNSRPVSPVPLDMSLGGSNIPQPPKAENVFMPENIKPKTNPAVVMMNKLLWKVQKEAETGLPSFSDVSNAMVCFNRTINSDAMQETDRIKLRTQSGSVMVLGMQSAGKSSLLCGLAETPWTLVRHQTGTRRATVLQFLPANDETRPLEVRLNGESVSSVLEVARTMGPLFARTPRDGEINVDILTQKCNGMTLIDTVGLVASNAGEKDEDLRKLALEVGRTCWTRYMLPEDSTCLCLLPAQLNWDRTSYVWWDILKTTPPQQRAAVNKRLAGVMTFGDEQLDSGQVKARIEGVTSWPALARALFNPMREVAGYADMPCFITALPDEVDKLLLDCHDDATMIKCYQRALGARHDALVRKLDNLVGGLPGFKGSKAEREFFMKNHVGLGPLTAYVQQHQRSAFLTNFDYKMQLLNERLNEAKQVHFSLERQLKEGCDFTDLELVQSAFRLFHELFLSAYQGEPLSQTGRSSFAATDFGDVRVPAYEMPQFSRDSDQHDMGSGDERLPVHSGELTRVRKPNVIDWVPLSSWNETCQRNRLRLFEEISFCASATPRSAQFDAATYINGAIAHSTASLPTFPFEPTPPNEGAAPVTVHGAGVKISHRTTAEIEVATAGKEQRFMKQFGGKQDPLIAGLPRAIALLREQAIRLVLMAPGAILRDELQAAFNPRQVTPNLAQFVQNRLETVVRDMIAMRCCHYIAKRYAASIWHIAKVVLEFMKTVPQLQALFTKADKDGRTFATDFEGSLQYRFYFQVYTEMVYHLSTHAQKINGPLTVFNAVFEDVSSMLVEHDQEYVNHWARENQGMLLAQLLSGALVNDNLTDQPGSAPYSFTRNEQEILQRVLNQQQTATRLRDPWQRAEMMGQLFDLADHPDFVVRPKRLLGTTVADLKGANHVLSHNFETRRNGFIRFLEAHLTNKAIEPLSAEFMLYAGAQNELMFYNLLIGEAHLKCPKRQPLSRNENFQVQRQRNFEEMVALMAALQTPVTQPDMERALQQAKYGFNKNEQLKLDVETAQAEVEQLEQAVKNAKWFGDYLPHVRFAQPFAAASEADRDY